MSSATPRAIATAGATPTPVWAAKWATVTPLSVIVKATERSNTRAASGITTLSAMSPVTALLLRICSNVVPRRERVRHPDREREDDEQPHVDGADVAEGRARAAIAACGAPRAGASRRVARMPRRGAAAVSVLMSVASFHRVEQVRFGDLVAGQLGRDDAVAQDERRACTCRAGRPRPTRRRSRRRRRGPARRSGRRAASACRCRRPRSARTGRGPASRAQGSAP